MLQVFCIATTEAEAEGLVSRVLQTGITRENISVAAGLSEMDQIVLPNRELRRHAWIGLGLGAGIGWFVGTAMIVLDPSEVPRWPVEALLVPLSTPLVGSGPGACGGPSAGPGGAFPHNLRLHKE